MKILVVYSLQSLFILHVIGFPSPHNTIPEIYCLLYSHSHSKSVMIPEFQFEWDIMDHKRTKCGSSHKLGIQFVVIVRQLLLFCG